MTDSGKPREWDLRGLKCRLTGDRGFLPPTMEVCGGPQITEGFEQLPGHGNPYHGTPKVCVIEKSAYDALKAENERLKRYRDDFIKKSRDYERASEDREELKAENERLKEALEKIADPRKRDHSEPDLYTKYGCVMHIAEQALRMEGK